MQRPDRKRPGGFPPGRPHRVSTPGRFRPGVLFGDAQKRSFSMTFVQAATKSVTNFSGASSWA